MVQIIRKVALPRAIEVSPRLRPAAAQALIMQLREPRPIGFPLLFNSNQELIEPVIAFLHEHSVHRGHTADTIRSYIEILYDWFETLEQNCISWRSADAVDLIAYRNRMMQQPSAHTGRFYRVSTINHRVRGVLRFYDWAVQKGWLAVSELAGQSNSFAAASRPQPELIRQEKNADRSIFALRQFETLPRPLTSDEVKELLARLVPPYDLMARWQLYTGLRVSELLRLEKHAVSGELKLAATYRRIDVLRKGRKLGYVIASESLMDETAHYISVQRHAWIQRARHSLRNSDTEQLFVNGRGAPVVKNTYQRVVAEAGAKCGIKATTHLLRATFACMLLARLEHLARQGAEINPLLVVKVLMGHERIETTDRYLRAIVADTVVLKDVLDTLFSGASR